MLSKNQSITSSSGSSSIGEPVGTNYSVFGETLQPLLTKHLPLNFKYFRPRKLSSFSDHERAILAQLDRLNVQFVTANRVVSSKSSSSTGSWGISKQFPNWHRQPYFHLLVLDADETDYKRKLRTITKKWIQNRRRDNDSYGIVYVHQGKMRKKMLKSGTMLDRLRQDASKDTVCNIDLEKSNDNDVADLLALLKEGIFSRFIYNLKKFSHQLHILEQTWNLPGWNFPQYFIIREGLALTCEMFALYRHAYSHYVALETMVSDDAIASSNIELDSPTTPLSASSGAANGYIPSQNPVDATLSASPSNSQNTGASPSTSSGSISSVTSNKELTTSPSSVTSPVAPPPKLSHRYQTQFPQIIHDVSTLPIQPILEMSLIENRKLINAHKISRFDLYNYLYSRMSILLFKMQLSDYVARKAISHFSQLPAKMLSETVLRSKTVVKMDKKMYLSYIHAWAYCSIRSVVEQCQQQAALSLDADTLTKLNCILGDLFILARDNLEALGQLYDLELGWEGFTIQENFEVSSPFPGSPREPGAPLPSSPGTSKGDATFIGEEDADESVPQHHVLPFRTDKFDTAQRLDLALSDQHEFDQIFLELSAAASRSYQNGDRRRLHLKLQGDIAAVRFKQRNFDETIVLLKSLIRQLSADGWEQLAGYFQIRLAECQRLTGKKHSYIKTILAILKNQQLPDERRQFFSQQFIDYDSKHLTEEITLEGDSHFAVSFPSEGDNSRALHGKSANQLDLFIEESHIPCHFSSIFLHDLQTERLTLTLKRQVDDGVSEGSTAGEPLITFSVDKFVVLPGESDSRIPVFFKKLGTYQLIGCTVRMKHVSFDLGIEPLDIHVHSSDPAIRFMYNTAKCLVVGQKQWVHLRTYFDEHSAHQVKMIFSPSPLLKVCHDQPAYGRIESLESAEGQVAKQNLDWHAIQINQDGDTLAVSHTDIEAHSCWHLLIPLICHKQTSAQCVVEKLSSHLQFHKDTDEPFSIKHDIDLSFFDPFLHFVYDTRISERETMLQISMECTNQDSVRIVSHSLQCSTDSAATCDQITVTDLNRNTLIHQTIHPENNLSFVYRMSHKDVDSKGEAFADFEVHYQVTDEKDNILELDSLPTQEKGAPFVYPVTGIRWKKPLSYEYRISAHLCEASMTLMHPVRYEFTIEPSRTGTTQPEERLIYEVDVDENLFFVSGERKKNIQLSERTLCSCTLIPIVSGFVDLPLIRLYRVDGVLNSTRTRISNSRVEHLFPQGVNVFVAPSKHDHIDALWKVDGDGLGTETSHMSQLSLRTPVVNFGDGASQASGATFDGLSPLRMIHEERFSANRRGASSTRSHHSRSRSDVSLDSMYSVSLGGSSIM